MINNSINIIKMNNDLWPHIIEHELDYNIWHPGFGQAQTYGKVKPVNNLFLFPIVGRVRGDHEGSNKETKGLL
jgi:hypothetical protein